MQKAPTWSFCIAFYLTETVSCLKECWSHAFKWPLYTCLTLFTLCIILVDIGKTNMTNWFDRSPVVGTKAIRLVTRSQCFYCSFHISLSKAFWPYLFYYLFFRTETFMIWVNVFNITRNKISAGSDKKREIFPIDPHYKNHPLL